MCQALTVLEALNTTINMVSEGPANIKLPF